MPALYPQNLYILSYWGKRSFTDLVKDLDMTKSSSFIQMDPKCHHMCPYKRESERTLTKQYDQGSRDWSDAATIQGMLAEAFQKLKEKRTGFSP